MKRIKKFIKNRFIGEALGIVIPIALLILTIVALTAGPVFMREHAIVILLLLVVIMVISGAA